jgi:hypothetical protein
MLHVHVYTAACPCCMTRSILYVPFILDFYVHAVFTSYIPAACMFMSICVYLTMLHIHVYAVFISYFHAACMSKCMLHAKSNCLSISMLHVYVHTAGQVYAARPIHPACPCQCCMSMPMLHVHVHALCLRSCCMPSPQIRKFFVSPPSTD